MDANLKASLEHLQRITRYEDFQRLFRKLCDDGASMRPARLANRLRKMKRKNQISKLLDTTSVDWDKKLAKSILNTWEGLRRCVVG